MYAPPLNTAVAIATSAATPTVRALQLQFARPQRRLAARVP